MKIGDFARLCGTRISILQHYDKVGVLRPIYTDRFTNYRYYDPSQAVSFERIRQLKAAGFTLTEIKRILYTDVELSEVFEKRKAVLERQLSMLEQLKKDISGGTSMEQSYKPLFEDIDLPFENDEEVIGKWLYLGEEDSLTPSPLPGDKNHCLYFLPNGEYYWCYGWTRGKLLVNTGTARYANDYRVERRDDGLYMTIYFKSMDYPQTGETTPMMLRKIDSRRYSTEEIARKDDINKPFLNDKRVIGKWKACGFLDASSGKDRAFALSRLQKIPLYFKGIIFSEGGHCASLYGEKWIQGDEMQVWTKGYVLRKWNSTACAYEIRHADGREYLIMEWKSGDYRWGGYDTDYYVFLREAE